MGQRLIERLRAERDYANEAILRVVREKDAEIEGLREAPETNEAWAAVQRLRVTLESIVRMTGREDSMGFIRAAALEALAGERADGEEG